LHQSKCLSQRDEVLPGADSIHRVQIAANIKTHRTYRRRVTHSHPHSIGVAANVTETNAGKNISTVIKGNAAQLAEERGWKSELTVDD